jgi:hypothetical protein
MICVVSDCSHAGEDQPIENFPVNIYEESGYSKLCKDCDDKVNKRGRLLQGTRIEYEKDINQKYNDNNVITVNGEKYDINCVDDDIKKRCVGTLITLRKTRKLVKIKENQNDID